MVGFISMNSRCPTWASCGVSICSEEIQVLLEVWFIWPAVNVYFGGIPKVRWNYILQQKFFYKKGDLECSGEAVWAPFPWVSLLPDLTFTLLTSLQQIQAQECVFWHTLSWGGCVDVLMLTLLWGYSGQPLLIRAKVDSTVCYVSGHQEAAD